jgi:putative addiction module component (TIGR02574 family)
MVALNTHQLLAEVDSMPIDLKTKLIEKLLSSLNPSHNDVETLWKQEIDSRVASIEKGAVNLIDGNDVFRKIKARFIGKIVSNTSNS